MQTVEATILFLETKLSELKEAYKAHKDGAEVEGNFGIFFSPSEISKSTLGSIKMVCEKINIDMPFEANDEDIIPNRTV